MNIMREIKMIAVNKNKPCMVYIEHMHLQGLFFGDIIIDIKLTFHIDTMRHNALTS